MLTRKCDICGAEMRKTTPRYKVTFYGWLYTEEIDICIDCFKRIADEIRPADTPQTETQTETQNSNLTFEKRTMRDCYNCKRYETEGECVECHYEPKGECAKEYEELGLKELKELIEADRKTEPSNSEKPNNCEVKNYCDDCLYADTCDSKEFFYACTSKATISKMEQVDKDINVRSKTERQTEGVWNAGYKTGYDKGYKDAQKVKDSQDLVKELVKAFGEDGTWLERQGVYTLTLAEAKQRAVDIIESVLAKDEPQTERSE